MSTTPSSFTAVSLDRRIQMLRTAMGPLIAAALEDPDVVEIMLNPDRTLWVDRLSTGRAPMGVELSKRTVNALFGSWRPMSVPRCIGASRC